MRKGTEMHMKDHICKKLCVIAVAALSGVALLSGVAGTAAAADSTDTVDMYRLYNPNSGEHFYTGSAQERDDLKAIGWRYEAVGWVAPAHSDTPVYRLYNPNASDHHYTTSSSERDGLLRVGWRSEGVGWYSSDDNRNFIVYRQYNPNAKSGAHNYTLSSEEINNLAANGWRDEGIAWYAVGGSRPAPVEPSKPAPPTPTPSPRPELPGQQITPGAWCKKSEVGQLGTAHGKVYVCAYHPGNKIPHWYQR